jgi:aryl-alcohol dehydrogenase-like predicted oxidoreductase
MNFGSIGRTGQDEATAMVDAALDAGINLIDTADMYGRGESEEMVGRAIAGRRDDIVLATKAECRWTRSVTIVAVPAAGWCRHSTTACAGSASTTSTSIRSIAGTRAPATRRPCRR